MGQHLAWAANLRMCFAGLSCATVPGDTEDGAPDNLTEMEARPHSCTTTSTTSSIWFGLVSFG